MCKCVLVTLIILLISAIIVGGYFLWIEIFGKRICERDTTPPVYKCSTTVTIFGFKECSFKNICLDATYVTFVPESDTIPQNKTTTIDLGGGSGSRMHTLTSDICNKFTSVKNYRASFLGLTLVHVNSFIKCKDLEVLNLGYNHLTHLPQSIFTENSEMKYLYLYYNRLREIDPGIFHKLLKLEKLHLEGNLLQAIPMRQLPVLPVLRSLFLNRNQLRLLEIKRFQKKFPRLRYLSVCDNLFIIGMDLDTLLEYFSDKSVQTDLRFCIETEGD